jgi:hypothetical protein
VTRYTFVVQIHPDGPSTLENLSTHERVRISDLASVGPQIEEWLAGLARSPFPASCEMQEEEAQRTAAAAKKK